MEGNDMHVLSVDNNMVIYTTLVNLVEVLNQVT